MVVCQIHDEGACTLDTNIQPGKEENDAAPGADAVAQASENHQIVVHTRKEIRVEKKVLVLTNKGKVKVETDEKFPGALGLDHEALRAEMALVFYDLLKKCVHEDEEQRIWFMHSHPTWMHLSGEQIIEQLGPHWMLDRLGMSAIWRVFRYFENKMYRGSKRRFRGVADPNLTFELMSKEQPSQIHFEYVKTMICEEYIGYEIQMVKQLMLLVNFMESWSVYAINTNKRLLVVMDPANTGEEDSVAKQGHRLNARKVLRGIVRCINECIPDQDMDRTGWSIAFDTGMHASCEREDTGIYCVHYLKEYTGAALATPITKVSAKFLRKSLAYQVCTLKNNRGELRKFMTGLKA